MATAHINIGSNLGNRLALLGQAVAAIEAHLGTKAVVSEPIESEPWGFDSPNRFINIGLNIEVGETDPTRLLADLTDIQNSIDAGAHRDHTGGYQDRAIDIDLIAIDGMMINCQSLQLPHPRMHLRRFVLEPMSQIWPGWIHPELRQTAAQLLEKLEQAL